MSALCTMLAKLSDPNTPVRLLASRVAGPGHDVVQSGLSAQVTVEFEVLAAVVFDLDLSLEILPASGDRPYYSRHLRQDAIDISWLPKGRYSLTWYSPCLRLRTGLSRWQLSLWHGGFGKPTLAVRVVIEVDVVGEHNEGDISAAWEITTIKGPDVAQLSWRRGHEDWFFRHFDHAARTIISYMLGDSPLLKGRILDVGCGDGITDLGIALRCQPETLVGIDPFAGFERLPQIIAANHLALDELPSYLRFLPADGNAIPFPDDSFDVVLSWGSLEHIAGGYMATLKEIKRVLKNGGLFFAHPGLYYSNFGHHLGEFSAEPFFHLTKSQQELQELVLNTPPKYLDRAGEFSSPAQYWQWYKELNPITVSGFERELRELKFELYRVALRTEDRIEYHHPALQNYSLQDLATVELYLSAWNRKA